MDTSTIELNRNEMETAAGSSISEIFQAMSMMWDIHNCENGSHHWEWQGELDSKVNRYWPYLTRNKIFVCTKCGKKQVSKLDDEIVGTYNP